MINLIFWSVFAFVIFGIVCLISYITNPKRWHEIVANIAFAGVVMLGLVNLLIWNWSVTL